ncbi:MAG TPA: type II secretion system protein [Armatimonadota bacterium]
MKRRAFTLIELLVVIAIIAVLASIIFPALGRASRSALRTQCVGNLRQISAATQAYVQDWDERYPKAVSPDAYRRGDRPSICVAMGAYITDERTWICSQDIGETFPLGQLGFRRRTPPFYAFLSTSYAFPGLGPPFDGTNPRPLAKRPVGQVKKPATTPLFWELRPWHGDFRPDDDFNTCPARYNVLYCDGHVAQEPAFVFIANQRAAFR